ncbi:MAG: bifunctional precorrin-2 dehydrogenase/sirohydrochlorin ferrochelatase [Gammaproteobacteria bacterium]|nr:bifunctional precorrin-2 dehydrogenase/sirohydrochlorin ferrochelatase [Gammaproteobacteria bacterium]
MLDKNNHFPLMVDLSNKKIIIIGSGEVARRKAQNLSGYGGNIQVIANSFTGSFLQLKSSHFIEFTTVSQKQLSESVITTLVKDAFLVIPATKNAEFNMKVTTIAQKMGILVNQVDTVGEVIIPSVINQGALSIGISTQGKSPALSRYTRQKLEKIITEEYAVMARLQEEMKAFYKLHIEDQQERKKLLWKILNNKAVWSALEYSYDKAIILAKEIK